ncbi:hypothetical protein MBLNU459_g4483t2 [Dothideomycetes sp. NU459]
MSSMFLALALFFSSALALPFNLVKGPFGGFNGTGFAHGFPFPTGTAPPFPTGTAPFAKRYAAFPTGFPTGFPFPTGTAPFAKYPTSFPSGFPTGFPFAKRGEEEAAAAAAQLAPRFEGARKNYPRFYPTDAPWAPFPTPTVASTGFPVPTAY